MDLTIGLTERNWYTCDLSLSPKHTLQRFFLDGEGKRLLLPRSAVRPLGLV